MKLNVGERIALLNVLPPQGNAVTLRIVNELQKELSFSEEEIKQLGIKNTVNPDGTTSIRWDIGMSDYQKDINIGEAAKGIITEQLKRLDAQNQLHITMLPLYEKFVEKDA